jgi:hypothetical protein
VAACKLRTRSGDRADRRKRDSADRRDHDALTYATGAPCPTSGLPCAAPVTDDLTRDCSLGNAPIWGRQPSRGPLPMRWSPSSRFIDESDGLARPTQRSSNASPRSSYGRLVTSVREHAPPSSDSTSYGADALNDLPVPVGRQVLAPGWRVNLCRSHCSRSTLAPVPIALSRCLESSYITSRTRSERSPGI